jgi:protoheme ferro-lyase
MQMPIRERRLNIQFINEHLEKLQEIRSDQQMVTANKPLVTKPGIKAPNDTPTYTSKVKRK